MKEKVCFILFGLLVLGAFPNQSKLVNGQINIDNIIVPSTVPLADRDTFRIQAAIDVAHKATFRAGLSSRVIIPAGKFKDKQYIARQYRLTQTITVRGGVVLSTDSAGRRGVRLQWVNVKDDQPLLKFHNCHGGGLENIALAVSSIANGQKGDRVTGILLESQSSAVLQNFTVDLGNAGKDSIGILLTNDQQVARHTESVTVRDFNIFAPRPVVINDGDNLTFSTFDLTLLDRHSPGTPRAIFQNRNGYAPANVVIGPGTGQKGDHAVYFGGQRERSRGTGDSLTIQNFRWEQGTSKGPAWKIDINRFDPKKPQTRLHAIESVVFINCRHGGRNSNPNYIGRDIPAAGVLKTSFLGGYYPGKFRQ